MPTPSLLIVPARFKSGKLYSQIPTSGDGDFTVTRNTTATRFGPDGLIASVASGIPRLDYYTSGGVTGCPALLVEPAALNLALHSRDLTNAVWSGTNITAAKNAVGADGVASGATTLTATAASGTILQSCLHSQFSRVFSAYVRRVTGTGAIQMTVNGGTNWDTVTISSTYTQVASVIRSVASGTVGFRMATSGDVIEVDFTQYEATNVTSPIPTTTASVTRSADVISVSGAVSGAIGQTEGTLYAEVDLRTFTLNSRILGISDGTASNRIEFLINTASRIRLLAVQGGVDQVDVSNASNQPIGIYKVAVGYAANNYVYYVNGVQIATDTSASVPATSQVNLGSAFNNTAQFNDRIRAAALYTTRLTDAELATLTTP